MCLLAQLEVSSHKFSVFVSELITEFLHSVLIDECTCCLTFCVDGAGYITEAFAHVIADRVNVAVCFAAALLCGEAIFGYAGLSCVEAVF